MMLARLAVQDGSTCFLHWPGRVVVSMTTRLVLLLLCGAHATSDPRDALLQAAFQKIAELRQEIGRLEPADRVHDEDGSC